MYTAKIVCLVTLAFFIASFIFYGLTSEGVADAVLPENYVNAVVDNGYDWQSGETYLDVAGAKKITDEWFFDTGYNFASIESDPVVIAVIDTGINVNHEMFKGKYDENGVPVGSSEIGKYDVFLRDADGNVISANTHNGTKSVTDDDPAFHGTHVAGIIAALIHSFSLEKYIKILPVKASYVLRGKSNFTATAFKQGIDFAVDNGADVVNLSIGGLGNAGFSVPTDKTEKAVFVAAAGNGDDKNYGINSDGGAKSYPGASDGVIGVANYAESSGLDIGENGKYALSATSNYGSAYDIAAPGSAVWSVNGSADTSYKPMNGTSMASPIVAFAVALLTLRYRAQSATTGFEPSPKNIYNILLKAPSGTVDRRQKFKNNAATVELNHPFGALELDSVAETDFLGDPIYADAVAPLTFDIEYDAPAAQEQGRIKPIKFSADVKPVKYPNRSYQWYLTANGAKTLVGTGKTYDLILPNAIGKYELQLEIEGCRIKPEPVQLEVKPKIPLYSEIKINVSNNIREDGKVAIGTKVLLKVEEIPFVNVDDLPVKWYVDGSLTAVGNEFVFSSVKSGVYTVRAEYDGQTLLSKEITVDESLNVNLLNFYSPYELFTFAAVGTALVGVISVFSVAAVRKARKKPNNRE